MPVRVLFYCLTAALVVAVALSGLSAAFVIIAPLVDQPLQTGLSAEVGADYVVQASTSLANTLTPIQITIDRGDILFVADSWPANLFRGLDVVMTGGFWIALIWVLRRFTQQAASDRPFSEVSVRQVRLAGLLLLVYPVWQAVRALMLQALVLGAQEDAVLVHTFHRGLDAGQIRLLPDIDPGLAIAGLILLVVAQAFSTGVEVQRDSDEVV